jgi:hypothetical protein
VHSIEKIDLGTYRGDDYFLTGFVEPEPEDGEAYDPDVDADGYGVSLAQSGSGPLEDNTEVVVLDTRHMGPHLDKRYLPPDADEEAKVEPSDEWDYSRMRQFLLTNWKEFVDCHLHYTE